MLGLSPEYRTLILGEVGQELFYQGDAVEIRAADPARLRPAETEVTWLPFRASVGQARIPEGDTDPARSFPNLVVIHTDQELDVTKLVRFQGREYLVQNYAEDDGGFGVGFRRYLLKATLVEVPRG